MSNLIGVSPYNAAVVVLRNPVVMAGEAVVVVYRGTSPVGVGEVMYNLIGVSPYNAAVVVLRNPVVMAGEAVVVV